MGREIEIKIPLSQEEYDFISSVIFCKSFIEGIALLPQSLMHIIKTDEYYSLYNSREESRKAGEPQVIRIRSEKYERLSAEDADVGNENVNENGAGEPCEKSFFCIKRKSLENGIELNREDETFVSDANVIRDILNISGYHKFFEKSKDALSVYASSCLLKNGTFHIELEKVNNLLYLEVEVTDENLPADKVRSALESFIELFSLDSSRRDSRSWMEILQGSSSL
ncbi:MAG: hypothetical protein IJ688_11295 [Treponema sp.]|nr:hypothetical protein [Treponema sp.]